MSPRRNWDSPNLSLASECAPPPEPKGVGADSPGEGLGESHFRRLQKKPNTLPTLRFGRSNTARPLQYEGIAYGGGGGTMSLS